jgi:hypothetical protein
VSFYGPGAPPPGWPGDPSSVPLLPSLFTFVNLGGVRNRGVELAGQFEWVPVSLQGSYTFQAVPALESGTDLPLQINRPPRHQGGVGLSYRFDRWSASGDVHYTGRAFWADVFTQPFWGYTDAYRSVERARELSSAEPALGAVAECDQPARRKEQEPCFRGHDTEENHRRPTVAARLRTQAPV